VSSDRILGTINGADVFRITADRRRTIKDGATIGVGKTSNSDFFKKVNLLGKKFHFHYGDIRTPCLTRYTWLFGWRV
jgi:hypothetical protein